MSTISTTILQQLPDFDGTFDTSTLSLHLDLNPKGNIEDQTLSAELDIPDDDYFDNLLTLINPVTQITPGSPAMSIVSPVSTPADKEQSTPSSVLPTPSMAELTQAPEAVPEALLPPDTLPLPPAMPAFVRPPALALQTQMALDPKSASSEVMAQAATESLLDVARTTAAKAKLELRKSLKADLSKRKSTLTVEQRSKLRSRREAAVSRQNKIAYASQLEVLVRTLVHNNLKLVGSLESTQ
jgi:hypothetical protein